jgi:hypothetical protein
MQGLRLRKGKLQVMMKSFAIAASRIRWGCLSEARPSLRSASLKAS